MHATRPLWLGDIRPGMRVALPAFDCSAELVAGYAELLDARHPIHVDAEYAKTTPFGRPIAHGMLVHALVSRLKVPMNYEVTDFGNMVNYGSDRLRFAAPVPSGCRIHAAALVSSWRAETTLRSARSRRFVHTEYAALGFVTGPGALFEGRL